jgi:Na+/phosphate symporter
LSSVSGVPAESLDASRQIYYQHVRYFRLASLVIILIGLMGTWLGYVKNARWVLFVQFVIAVWAFSLFVLPIAGPILRGQMTVSVAEWAYIAIHQSGLLRSYAESSLIFGLMILALILPVKSVFWPRSWQLESKRPHLRIACVAGLLADVIVCFLWINFRQYEITPAQMNSWQMMPAPPSPPSEKN